jgi:hypothetical protein
MDEEDQKTNTIKVVFPVGSREPSDFELLSFAVSLGLKGEEVRMIYRDGREKWIYIKLEDGLEENVLREYEEAELRFENGSATKVRLMDAMGLFKYVRVFGIPPEIKDETLIEALSPYGEVLSVRWEKFHPSYNVDCYDD